MKKILYFLLFIPLALSGQAWNEVNAVVSQIPQETRDSQFVLEAWSRDAIKMGKAEWVPATSSGASYKVYTALLTQSGTDAPVATVLENTLGGTVVWTRFSQGFYEATLSSAFTLNKTFTHFGTASLQTFSTDVGGNNIEGYYIFYRINDSVMRLLFYNSSYAAAEISDYGINIPIEIRVYP